MSFFTDSHPQGEDATVKAVMVPVEECDCCRFERENQGPEQLMAFVMENEYTVKMCKYCRIEMEMAKRISGEHAPGCDGHCCDDDN